MLPAVEISEMSVIQSVECPLTVKDTAVVSGHLSTRNGIGAGSISLALRRVLSHTAWAEVIWTSGLTSVYVENGNQVQQQLTLTTI